MKLITTLLAICLFSTISFSQHLLKDIGAGNGNTEVIAFESTENNASTDSLAVVFKKSNTSEISFGVIKQTIDTLIVHFTVSEGAYGSITAVNFFKGQYYTAGYQNGQRVIYRFSKNGQATLMDDMFSSEIEANKIQFFENSNYLIFKENIGNTHYLHSMTTGQFGILPIFQSTNSNSISEVFLYNDVFIFRANSVYDGTELFTTTGQYGSPQILKDIVPGATGSFPGKLQNGPDGKFYFFANDPTSGNTQIFESDGTTAGTTSLSLNYPPNFHHTELSFAGDYIFFNVYARFYSLNKNTNSYTDLLGRDLYLIAQESHNGLACFVIAEYLGASKYRLDLWTSDGTAGNSSFLKTLVPETGWTFGEVTSNSKGLLFQFKNNFVDEIHSSLNYWFTDGTLPGTRNFQTDYGNNLANSHNKLIGVLNDNFIVHNFIQNKGFEFIHTDGQFDWDCISDINQQTFSSSPSVFFSSGDHVFFMASDNLHGRELWQTDGTNQGTQRLFDWTQNHVHFLNGDSPHNSKSDFAVVNDGFYYVDNTLYLLKKFVNATQTSSTVSSYSGIIDYNNLNTHRTPELTPFGNKIVFRNVSGSEGEEPWISDGTSFGTTILKDLNVGQFSSYPSHFTAVNSNLIFFKTSSPNAFWKTDGSSVGTSLIDFLPANISLYTDTKGLVRSNSGYFPAYNWNTSQYVIVKVDENNVQVLSGDGFSPSSPAPIQVGSSFYYKGVNENQKSVYELNGSDVINNLFTTPAYFSNLVSVNSEIFFSMENGTENWLYKVTGSTYQSVVKINNNSYSNLYSINQNRFLITYDDYTQNEKHFIISDGSVQGTKEIFTLKGSYPIGETFYHQNKFYFNFTTEKSGSELWVIDLSCPDQITLNEVPVEDGRFDSATSISIDQALLPKIELNAGNKIELNPGTLIPGEKPFKAEIRDCGY